MILVVVILVAASIGVVMLVVGSLGVGIRVVVLVVLFV